MRHAVSISALVLALALSAPAPVAAQNQDDELGEGLDLLSEGARRILEGLAEEMRPMFEEAQPFLEEEFLPMVRRLADMIDDLGRYELPERLPNGDIIIRRIPDAPQDGDDPLPEPGEGGDVEL